MFFGQFCPLSNFHECEVTIDGHKYPTTEHYIQEQKAIEFNCEHIARKIRDAKTASEAKSLSYDITGFDSKHWASIASDYLETALKNKFAQNAHCRQYLLKTGDKSIGEATRD